MSGCSNTSQLQAWISVTLWQKFKIGAELLLKKRLFRLPVETDALLNFPRVQKSIRWEFSVVFGNQPLLLHTKKQIYWLIVNNCFSMTFGRIKKVICSLFHLHVSRWRQSSAEVSGAACGEAACWCCCGACGSEERGRLYRWPWPVGEKKRSER